MSVNSFVSNQGTQQPILTDNTGGTSPGTVIPIMKVSLDPQGTFSSIWNGVAPGLVGSVLTTAQAVGTSAGTALPASSLTNRKTFIGYNIGTTTLYIGGSAVTTTTGIPISVGQYTPAIDLGAAVLYAIAGTSGGTMLTLEVS